MSLRPAETATKVAQKPPRNEEDRLPAKRYSLREVETYEIPRDKFESIRTEASGIGTALSLACACLPTAITLTVTLLQTTVSDQGVAMRLWGLIWACYILGAYFTVTAFRQRGRLDRMFRAILESQVPPPGGKGMQANPDLTVTSDPQAPPLPDTHDTEEA